MPIPLIAPLVGNFVRNNFRAIVCAVVFGLLVGSTLYYRLRYSVAVETIVNRNEQIRLLTGERQTLRDSLDEQNRNILRRYEEENKRQLAAAQAVAEAMKEVNTRMGRAQALLDAKPGADPCRSADDLVNEWRKKR